jgi:hypothetical protein
MHRSSYYKEIAGKLNNNTKTSSSSISIKNIVAPTHIKLNSPSVELTGNCHKFKYNIGTVTNTNFAELPSNPERIIFCIYRIVHCKNRSNAKLPFLQYLLYKYPDKIENVIVFPFIKYKGGNIMKVASKHINSISNKTLECDGFIENENNLYLFYNISNNDDYIIREIKLKTRSDVFWWALIDEICNQRSILNIPIHKSVYNIFFKNPALLYITYDDSRIEIPIVAYYGNYYKFIPIVAAMGQQAVSPINKNSSMFYFGSFRKAIRYGVWTPNYTIKYLDNKQITDVDGRYNEGGIIRYALFLGKSKVPLNEPYERLDKVISNTDWISSFQSLIIGSTDYDHKKLSINPEYVVLQTNQSTSLSYHKIDNKSVNVNWDPLSNNYSII